jgi:hypothetical protein
MSEPSEPSEPPEPALPTGAPPEVATALERLRADLTAAAGDNLAGLVVYGSLARGRYRAGRSDVNLVVLLRDTSAEALSAVSPALRSAWAAIGVEPLLLSPGEVAAVAAAFPSKFLDIVDHHLVLAGEDPFATLEVPREALRQRVAQALRNLQLRLRRRYVTAPADPEALANALAGALAEVARPLAAELAALLRLAGREVPTGGRTDDVLAAAASAFDLDGPALARLAALRQGPDVGPDVGALYGSVLADLGRCAAVAETLREAPA